MEYRAKDHLLYKIKDWLSNESYTLMAKAQMLILKTLGTKTGWDMDKIEKLTVEEKAKLLVENDILDEVSRLKNQAAILLVESSESLILEKLPQDLILHLNKTLDKLFVEAQPKIEEPVTAKKK